MKLLSKAAWFRRNQALIGTEYTYDRERWRVKSVARNDPRLVRVVPVDGSDSWYYQEAAVIRFCNAKGIDVSLITG